MNAKFQSVVQVENLHDRVTRALALRVIEAQKTREQLVFPNEAELCQQLNVSRSILREAVKVLSDKGMLEVRPRLGTRSKSRSEWRLLDPDILRWQSEVELDASMLHDLCEVRLAIEPTAAGFAALRASADDIAMIERCLILHEQMVESGDQEQVAELHLQFCEAVVAASHNPLLQELSASIRPAFRVALSYTVQNPASETLGAAAHRALFEAVQQRDPMQARAASEQVVGLAMIAVERVLRKRGQVGKPKRVK